MQASSIAAADVLAEQVRSAPFEVLLTREMRPVAVAAPRRSVLLSVYRVTRALIRRRQESAAVKAANDRTEEFRLEMVRGLKEAANIVLAKERKIEELQESLKHRETIIHTLREVELPKLEREKEVLAHECELLVELRERDLTHIKAATAAHNHVITEAEMWENRMRSER